MKRSVYFSRNLFVISRNILFTIFFLISLNNLAEAKSETFFKYGVASGDPLTDSIIIWTRVESEEKTATVEYQVAKDPDFNRIVSYGKISTNKDKDYTVKLDIKALKPGKSYYYRFKYHNKYSISGKTKTLPEETNSFKIAAVSCQNYAGGFFTAYKYIVKDQPDLIIALGDYIYEHQKRWPKSPRIDNIYAKDLETYRQKYKLYLTDPDIREARSKIPMMAIWDDHEVKNDYSGKSEMAEEPERMYDAYQAFFEYLPIREQKDFQIYRNIKIGSLIDLFMIDGRQYRDKTVCTENLSLNIECSLKAYASGRTYLGKEQKEWLGSITKSEAQWQVIGNNTVMLDLNFLGNQINFDQWDGYYSEKSDILEKISNNKNINNNLLVITGDVHTFIHGNIRHNNQNIGTEITTSGLSSPSPDILKKYQFLVPLLLSHVKYIEANYRGYTLLEFKRRKVGVKFFAMKDLSKKDGERFLLHKFEIMRKKKDLEI